MLIDPALQGTTTLLSECCPLPPMISLHVNAALVLHYRVGSCSCHAIVDTGRSSSGSVDFSDTWQADIHRCIRREAHSRSTLSQTR